MERVLFDDATGQRLASTEQVTMCRGDGGFSADAQQSRQPATASGPSVPERAPDRSVDVVTLPQAALMYRLCADPNPLHADPSVARAAGFDRPILHGLCTYGIAARAIIETCCGNDPRLLRRLDARFSAPVFPGETIRTQIWRDGEAIRFHCLVAKRGIVVISSSVAEVGESVPA